MVNFADAETPGVIWGGTAALTLANAPSPATSLQLFLNGLLLTADVDYTLAANSITPLYSQQPGDSLQAWYRY